MVTAVVVVLVVLVTLELALVCWEVVLFVDKLFVEMSGESNTQGRVRLTQSTKITEWMRLDKTGKGIKQKELVVLQCRPSVVRVSRELTQQTQRRASK
eukprot:m.76547 g.76547  ORF g.76547 m.76547 type:complete len:98 (+) comp14033_c0_seq1:791-1084(+)